MEGTDYRLEYDPQTQLMRIVLLKESHRPIVIFFIADYVATQELADNPLLAGSYKKYSDTDKSWWAQDRSRNASHDTDRKFSDQDG